MRDVEIRDLVLRLPGVTREQASTMAVAIARRLTDTAPEWRATDPPALARIRVQVKGGASTDEIVRDVASAIAGALR